MVQEHTPYSGPDIHTKKQQEDCTPYYREASEIMIISLQPRKLI